MGIDRNKFNTLHVYLNEDFVGVLQLELESDELAFTYSDHWQQHGFSISPAIPFGEKIPSSSVKRFLENLFPEGNALEELMEQFRVGLSNTFAITKIIGKETTGALSFLPPESQNGTGTTFREISSVELGKRLDERPGRGLAVWDGKIRLSVAGVQDKLPITRLSDGRIGFGEGSLASTHILKFQKFDNKIPFLVLNEYFCMGLAKKVGIDVPEIEFLRFANNPALMVKRFDRIVVSDQSVRRLHVIDSCQALNLLSSYRYERNFGSGRDVADVREGVSFAKIFKLIEKCDIPAVNQLKVLDWMIFNLLIGNSDAHGKNISFFVDKKGMRLTPFYDLVNVSIYEELDHELAMSIGDEFSDKAVKAFQFAVFCDENQINRRLLAKRFIALCDKVKSQLPSHLAPVGTNTEREFWNRMVINIQERLEHYEAMINEIPKMKF